MAYAAGGENEGIVLASEHTFTDIPSDFMIEWLGADRNAIAQQLESLLRTRRVIRKMINPPSIVDLRRKFLHSKPGQRKLQYLISSLLIEI